MSTAVTSGTTTRVTVATAGRTGTSTTSPNPNPAGGLVALGGLIANTVQSAMNTNMVAIDTRIQQGIQQGIQAHLSSGAMPATTYHTQWPAHSNLASLPPYLPAVRASYQQPRLSSSTALDLPTSGANSSTPPSTPRDAHSSTPSTAIKWDNPCYIEPSINHRTNRGKRATRSSPTPTTDWNHAPTTSWNSATLTISALHLSRSDAPTSSASGNYTGAQPGIVAYGCTSSYRWSANILGSMQAQPQC